MNEDIKETMQELQSNIKEWHDRPNKPFAGKKLDKIDSVLDDVSLTVLALNGTLKKIEDLGTPVNLHE